MIMHKISNINLKKFHSPPKKKNLAAPSNIDSLCEKERNMVTNDYIDQFPNLSFLKKFLKIR